MKIHKGDTVRIMVGKDAGKSGKVLEVRAALGKVLVEGLNMFKKHRRPRRQGEKGEIVNVSRPVSAANVAMVCSTCNKPARIGFKIDGNKKTRICRKCQNPI